MSRNFVVDKHEIEQSTIEMVLSINISDEKQDLFREETSKDPVLSKLLQLYKKGWPNSKSKLPDTIKPYFRNRSEIFVENDLIFLNHKLMVPQALRYEMLLKLHEPHLGITKTKVRARELLYWPGMSVDIENHIKNCWTCVQCRPESHNEPMISHDIPEIPFHKVGCDIFEYNRENFLIVIDYLSKWIEIEKIKTKTAADICSSWSKIFSRFGIPAIVIADNMPFGSYACREFASRWNFKIVTSSPNYPKSNGLAERGVQIAKNLLKKSSTLENFCISLLEYNNTPVKHLDVSPAQILMNRRLRTKIPVHMTLLKSGWNKNIKKAIKHKQFQNERYYNRKARRHETNFSVDEKVYCKIGNNWEIGHIKKKLSQPRSYIVSIPSKNREYRRNSKFLKNCESKTNIGLHFYDDHFDHLVDNHNKSLCNKNNDPGTFKRNSLICNNSHFQSCSSGTNTTNAPPSPSRTRSGTTFR